MVECVLVKSGLKLGVGLIVGLLCQLSAQAMTWEYYLDANKTLTQSGALTQQEIYQSKKTVSLRSKAIKVPEYSQPLTAVLSLMTDNNHHGQVVISILGAQMPTQPSFQSKIMIEGVEFVADYQTTSDKAFQTQLSTIYPKDTNYQKLSAFDWLMLFAQADKPMKFYLPLQGKQTVAFDFNASEPLNGSFLVGSYLNDEKTSNFLFQLKH